MEEAGDGEGDGMQMLVSIETTTELGRELCHGPRMVSFPQKARMGENCYGDTNPRHKCHQGTATLPTEGFPKPQSHISPQDILTSDTS